jgi:hypothetical protein
MKRFNKIGSPRLVDHGAIGVPRRLGSGAKAKRIKESGFDGGWPIAVAGWPLAESCVFQNVSEALPRTLWSHGGTLCSCD